MMLWKKLGFFLRRKKLSLWYVCFEYKLVFFVVDFFFYLRMNENFVRVELFESVRNSE